MLDMEMRHVAMPVEYRAAGDGPGSLDGYAAVYNRYSQNLGGFVEQVDPGAFTKSIADGLPVVARYNHDDSHLLGTTEAGTLRLESDVTGLRYVVDLPPTTSGNDVAALAARGDLRYSSFAFHVIEDDWSVTEQGFPLRTLRSVQLIDVAPVNNPAYRDTSVGMRSLATRLHLDVDAVTVATTEEIRSLLNGEPIDIPVTVSDVEQVEDVQGDTHTLDLARRRLELERLR